ncbi:TatD family hydrolase [Paenibacillus sp. FSL R5-0527]|uniref:TatD related DNase family protein n=2 Tax=Paenibacillus macerans TaxID=44252 RepID=A0A090Z9I5_PAEMA|nr:TatD family hydrolase [Paenibacillus macerans]KFN07033.1 tatD related DNase family protein [Paenibacillus macerans]MCY7562866.1 TatD family hydrolase [Paenibacillus macerans]MEC0154975.1 TatD family hydrolase [Paenibacillus macerans]MEC0331403.1 TatD family hydrolase [Paenibacillus macerans]OMG45395.1 DNAase [Paenibacillus macerans]
MSSKLPGLPLEAQWPKIDAHVHIDLYDEADREKLLQEMPEDKVEAVIAVSMNLASSRLNLSFAERYPGLVYPAFGYHPEQPVPTEDEADRLLNWMEEHAREMIAVGEIGLPYYLRKEALEEGRPFDLEPYLELLERLMLAAKRWNKPVVLHAVYEDAELVCDMLERHGLTRAHFHWFKGAEHTVRRMADRGYYISFTPDILYERDIQELAGVYPADLVMAETDGPWPFEGPFSGRLTRPAMVGHVAAAWAGIHGIAPEEAAAGLYRNTRRFYGI